MFDITVFWSFKNLNFCTVLLQAHFTLATQDACDFVHFTLLPFTGRKLQTTEAEQDARWTEHFSEILNRPPPLVEASIQEAETDLDISTGPPTRGEIIAAIKTLKNY